MFAEITLILIGIVLLYEAWKSHFELSSYVEDPRITEKPLTYPPISVIRPIKGLDAGAMENLEAALDTGYSGEMEIFFVFDDEKEPLFEIVKDEISRLARQGKPINAKIVLSGNPPAGRTGKLNAMIAGLNQAKHDIIVFVDSDIRTDKENFNKLIETLLETPGAGAAFTPVIASAEPKTSGDVAYSLMLNGLYSPASFLTAKKNDFRMSFIMGQLMALKRDAIREMGGLEAVEGQLVDDMYIGKLMIKAGYSNIMTSKRVDVIEEGMRIKSFWGLYRKWMTFSRSGLPGKEFKMISWLRGILFWAGLLFTLVGLYKGFWVAAVINALVPLSIGASVNMLHRLVGGHKLKLRHLWVSFAVFLTAPIVYLSIFTRRKVVWRGRSYELNGSSKLAVAKVKVEEARGTYPQTDRRRIWVYVSPDQDRRRLSY